MTRKSKVVYTCIVQDGRSFNYNEGPKGEILDRSPVVRKSCGHNHRTSEAAEKCLARLTNWSPDSRRCNADWFHGRVHPHYEGSMDYLDMDE